jgi:hypothetical protein
VRAAARGALVERIVFHAAGLRRPGGRVAGALGDAHGGAVRALAALHVAAIRRRARQILERDRLARQQEGPSRPERETQGPAPVMSVPVSWERAARQAVKLISVPSGQMMATRSAGTSLPGMWKR